MFMRVSKSLIIPVAAIGIIGASGATVVAASTSQPTLAQDIANKFHLDQSQVQSMIDQHKSVNQQNREAKYEERLTEAVKDGKLTDAQKQLVLTEHNKLVAELTASSRDNRKQTMQSVRQEAKDWAAQNNIDAKWLLPRRGMAGPPTNNQNSN
jgi:flagellum-specific peptidoglycan hydrolase FlgJ